VSETVAPRRRLWPLGAVFALVSTLVQVAGAQVSGQSFQVRPLVHRATVGDTVTLEFRVRLDERDLLFDTIPQPLNAVPAGVRIISIEKLNRTPDRIFHGRARLAFYRTGRQPVPVFMLPFMRAVKGVQRATLTSDSAFVEIGSLLPAGNPPLKDIRELRLHTGPDLRPIIALTIIALLAFVWYVTRRLRRSPPREIVPATAAPELPPTPYEYALAQLARIERQGWPAQGQTPLHYEETVNVLRSYLESEEGVPARERTTEELVWALPPHLTEQGLQERLRDILEEADLVKFARLQPNQASASLFLRTSMSLLEDWHRAAPTNSAVDALR
jgi:hypothetical protein